MTAVVAGCKSVAYYSYNKLRRMGTQSHSPQYYDTQSQLESVVLAKYIACVY
jgi:hypothetical protein